LDINDSDKNTVLKIKGPSIINKSASLTFDNEFELLTVKDKTKVGAITKKHGGYIAEKFTKADVYEMKCNLFYLIKSHLIFI
jgi:hypothetical protein